MGGAGRADGGPRTMYPPVGGLEMITNSGNLGTWVDLRSTKGINKVPNNDSERVRT
jgi:hypothetical protein